MPNDPNVPTVGSQVAAPSSKASALMRITRCFTTFSVALLILASCTGEVKQTVAPPKSIPIYNSINLSSTTAEQNVQYQASLIRDNLPVYLDFIGSEVLPVMSGNIDVILQNLNGLTDISPGQFYHGHIDYSTKISGGIEGLLEMNNLVLQYHTLENPRIFIPYWKEELGDIHDQHIDAWLERVNEYNKAISTPSAASGVQYTPLLAYEAAQIASHWDGYRRQNGLPSPGIEMLTNMVYLVDGGKQPLYQESFKNIYRFHNIAFGPEGYLQLDNASHLENIFSPFQINFEKIDECQELLPVFEAAGAVGFLYIINPDNAYIRQYSGRLQDPEMAKLSIRLKDAISHLPDDNMIKISNTPENQQMAFFVSGNYIFAVHGSLDSPPIFK